MKRRTIIHVDQLDYDSSKGSLINKHICSLVKGSLINKRSCDLAWVTIH
jgi:hypothetical protein